MVYRKDTNERYKLFLNEWLEYIQAAVPVTALELTRKYGVSTNFPTFLSKIGIFKNKGGGAHPSWTTNRDVFFSDDEVKNLIDQFNGFKYAKKNPVKIEDRVLNGTKDPKTSKILSEFSTQELVGELKHRGYTGSIVMHKEVNF